MVTQKRFWQQMYHFLQENDVLIVEQGTPFFGSAAIPLPNNTAYVGQPLWDLSDIHCPLYLVHSSPIYHGATF